MIIIFKKNHVLLCTLIAVLSLFSLCLLPKDDVASVSSIGSFNKSVIIDAGHGAPDGGATGDDGTLEKDLNLSISTYLQYFLEQSGATVLLTRADDNGIFDEDLKKIKQMKVSDIKNREKLMNDSNCDIFVSIHANKFPQEKYSGPQVFHAKTEESKKLAEYIQSRLTEIINPPSVREIKEENGDIYLLKKAKIPAVLVECGFLSNPDELALLKKSDYQKRLAWAIYCGICDYFAEEG